MAHIEKKIVKGHRYYYACQKGRVDGKPRNVWQKYLGTAEDIICRYEVPSAVCTGPVEADIAEYGSVTALLEIARELRLVEIINRHIPEKARTLSVGDYMLLAAFNRCVCPSSKRQLGSWYAGTSLPRILGFKDSQLSSQRFWDHMKLLNHERIRAIEKDLSEHMINRFEIDLSCLLYDPTNFFTFIDTFTEGDLAKRGKNKQGRANLRQVGLALMVTRDFHIPLLHEVYAGNRHDAEEFASVTDILLQRYKALSAHCEDITLVFDKGNNSEQNLEMLAESAFHFVGSVVPTHYPELLAIPISKFKTAKDERLSGIKTYRRKVEIFGAERTVVITHNDNLLEKQFKTIGLVIAKARGKLNELQLRLKRAKKRNAGKKPTVEGTQKQINVILSARHLPGLIETKLKKDRWGLCLSYLLNRSALTELIKTLFGKKILFTDQEHWSDEEIVLAYHGQACIEEAFKRMKDPHFLSWHPQYHWTDHMIEVHGFYCVLALTLASLLRRELSRKGVDLSIPKMFRLLKDIREIALIYPERKPRGRKPRKIQLRKQPPQERDRIILSTMNSQQKQLYQVLNLEHYRSVNATKPALQKS